MDTTSYVALSRQMTLQRHMAAVANNIANAATTGYRGEHMLFEAVLAGTGEPGGLAFVQDVGLYRDPNPGPINGTGNPLDIAVDGEGYFTFSTQAGERYGRAGHLAIDASGQLTDPKGNPILDESGQPIAIPPGSGQLTISGDGTIAGTGGQIARLQLVTFANEQALNQEGGGLYRAEAVPRPATGRVLQGALEASNVTPVLEMTTMLATVRAFEGVQKMIDTQHELDRRAIERLASAGS